MHDPSLLTTIAAGFAAAWVLGLITQLLRLSPIVGYLLAGVVIGPYTPGFVGDARIAHELSEIGVILLMFGVGLHFHFKDLFAVKNIAVPGAVAQSLVATLSVMFIFHYFGWTWKASFIVGMAMAVASTVVLMRVLMDRNMLNTVHGHVAVGWLIVEDIFTVLMLVLLPMLGSGETNSEAESSGLMTILWALGKLAALIAITVIAGSRLVPWILTQVARLRSRELFTLTVLVLSVAVAIGAAKLFGASPALGAFLAGMVVGQSPVSYQAGEDVLPMRDAFAVLFFVSVGMLFDPAFLAREPWMMLAAVGVVMLVKPFTALAIVALFGYSARTALTVALGLAQIGEFSFILSQIALSHKLISDEAHHVLVGTAIISITINPLLFRNIDRIERWLQRWPRLWSIMNARAMRRLDRINAATMNLASPDTPLAIIVGYGPVGRIIDALLRDSGLETVVVDQNMDTVQALSQAGRRAIFGDGTRREMLIHAGIKNADHLVIALPHSVNLDPLVVAARELNSKCEITVRTRYLQDKDRIRKAGASTVMVEEGEVGIALARHVMAQRGISPATINKMLNALRRLWKLETEQRDGDRS